MFDNFTEYMYYLLTTPFKRVKKSINNWYKLFKVLGKSFDESKADILRARDESMIAACSDVMLKEHASDRGLTRYDGETYDNFRKRIALYLDVCKLAGTNGGVIKAVKSLGYNKAEIVLAKHIRNDPERWAEFYVVISMNIDDNFQIKFNILKKEVRKNKEVGAKDNYLFSFNEVVSIKKEIIPSTISRIMIKNEIDAFGIDVVRLVITQSNTLVGYCRTRNQDAWYFDGTYNFDGNRMANAIDFREEL